MSIFVCVCALNFCDNSTCSVDQLHMLFSGGPGKESVTNNTEMVHTTSVREFTAYSITLGLNIIK